MRADDNAVIELAPIGSFWGCLLCVRSPMCGEDLQTHPQSATISSIHNRCGMFCEFQLPKNGSRDTSKLSIHRHHSVVLQVVTHVVSSPTRFELMGEDASNCPAEQRSHQRLVMQEVARQPHQHPSMLFTLGRRQSHVLARASYFHINP